MNSNLFQKALQRDNESRPPVWFMRQAGRYHSHYQELKKKYTFMELCKLPDVAAEAAMGPIRDFDFDAAILFSDLLFPLEVMGTGLRYDPGPKLDHHLTTLDAVKALKGGRELVADLQFQAEAMKLLRAQLPMSKGLLGFVGGPLTLFCYAVEGSHSGNFASVKAGFTDGRWQLFCEKLTPLLAENMLLQARAGADTVAMLDTCAGDFSVEDLQDFVLPVMQEVLQKFHTELPGYPVTYYSRGTAAPYWRLLRELNFAAIGVDWRNPMPQILDEFAERFAIQGNFDPELMLLPRAELETRLRRYFTALKTLPQHKLRGYICGLGHGVLQKTPEENVKIFLQLQREYFL